jgi:hypothetical protein
MPNGLTDRGPKEPIMTAKQRETGHRADWGHARHEHEHGPGCGHEAVPHGDHVDYIHEGHRHAAHEDHYDEHSEGSER